MAFTMQLVQKIWPQGKETGLFSFSMQMQHETMSEQSSERFKFEVDPNYIFEAGQFI